MTEATDEQLAQAVARGDLDAFNEIVLRYQHPVWTMACRFLGDSMEAEDVTQDTFLKFLEAAPRYRPTASFRAYLFRILTRLCIDHSRKKRPMSTAGIPEITDPSSSPADDLLAGERSAQIRTALATLPPNQKAAMVLRHYEGLSYAEVAQILGITLKAVERLLSRARGALQSRLSDRTRN